MSFISNILKRVSTFFQHFFPPKPPQALPPDAKKPPERGNLQIVHHRFASQHLERQIDLMIYLPFGFEKQTDKTYPALLFNDGQDLAQMNMVTILEKTYAGNRMAPHVVVGMFAADRLQEYGTDSIRDYQNRGSRSGHHIRFVLQELLPFLEDNFRVTKADYQHSIAGFSLGGLSALYLAWQYPQKWRRVGVFSGSLWWRHKAFDPKWPDAHLIMHHIIVNSKKRKHLRLWFQTGTEDETDDRNNNGVIDSIDDTLLLIKILKSIGYSAEEVAYFEMEGGRHEPKTWGEAMPRFLGF